MSDKEIKQAATATDAAEPAKKKTTAKKTDAAKTAAKVAETAAKVAEAAAKVAEAAAKVAETAMEEPAAKKPAASKTKATAAEAKAPAAEKKPAAKKPAAKKADTAEKKPAAKKTVKAAAPEKEVAATEDKAEVKKPAAKKPAAKAAKKEVPAKKYSQDGRYRLYARYKEEIVPALVSERGYKNVNQVPGIDKIVLNMRLGDVKDNSKSVQTAITELGQIAGQKPVPCKAKKSVANFKLREGMVIGAKTTLRGLRAYEFLDKLISIALPRVRDFRGISGKAFDGRGNYALGVKEQIIFPEISYELVEKLRGFDIAIITTAKTDDEAKALLTKMGMPFRN